MMSQARERVLETAEHLFHQNGYQSVTMRDIAAALGIKQASLYYHVPGGKEQLFVEVTERGLARHQAGLTQAIARAEATIEAQLQAVVRWIFSQPPLYLFKMMEHDMPELSEENNRYLNQVAYRSLFAPLTAVFRDARGRGELRAAVDPDMMTGVFLTILEGIAFAHRTQKTAASPVAVADQVIDFLLNGMRPA